MPVTAAETTHAAAPAPSTRPILIWLVVVACLLIAMIVVGGATRLTDSGLSITEWKPIHGVIPPLNATQWEEEFARYREIPEFKIKNFDMDLEGFKGIFWWEWGHRLLGRVIGFVVFVPLVVFWVQGRLTTGLKVSLTALLVLGGLQGVIGWWMVVSGLTERTDVSQYRLAIHLTLAFVILAFTVWVARSLLPVRQGPAPPSVTIGAWVLAALVFVQVFLGGLVAGLDAGLTFNTWPLMDGTLVPGAAFQMTPWWLNVFENVAMVQLQHRLVAYVLVAVAAWYAWRTAGTAFATTGAVILVLVLAQAAIGIATLVLVVPLGWALLHQVGAALVLIAVTAHLYVVTHPDPALSGQRATP